MSRMRILIIFILSVLAANCFSANHTTSVSSETVATDKTIPIVENTPDIKDETNSKSSGQSKIDRAIRKTDFNNFQYRWCDELHYLKKSRLFRLQDGEQSFFKAKDVLPQWEADLYLANVFYQDITGDGKEEAVVVINGSEYPGGRYGCTYIFAQNGGKLKEIWHYGYGEKWEDGPRKISFDDPEIVFELFTLVPDTDHGGYLGINNKNTEKFYKRINFKWDKKKIIKVSEELIPNAGFSCNFLGFFINGKKIEE